MWCECGSAGEFIAQAQAAGYEIGHGLDRHPYRAITPAGTSIDLVRQLDGFKKRDVQERFKGYNLPTEAQALKACQERRHEQQQTPKDVFEQLHERDRRTALLREFKTNVETPANDNQPDIFDQLKDKQANQNWKRERGLEL